MSTSTDANSKKSPILGGKSKTTSRKNSMVEAPVAPPLELPGAAVAEPVAVAEPMEPLLDPNEESYH